ncbi:response regulator [Larkinella harenae]
MNQTIFIVDDDADFRLVLQQLFGIFLPRYSVRFFNSGESLLEQLPTSDPPGLILMDLHMRGLSGQQTLVQLKEQGNGFGPHWPYVPVVIFSSAASDQEKAACYQAGASSFITKVPDFSALKELLGSLCHYWLDLNKLPARSAP